MIILGNLLCILNGILLYLLGPKLISMGIAVSILILIVAVCFLFLYIKEKKKCTISINELRKELASIVELNDTILSSVDAYVILANKDFIVEKTNYYRLNKEHESNQALRVGELLRCKNGLDAGKCGTHVMCSSCPVRAAINKCFENKNSFSKLDTSMRLYVSTKIGDFIDCEVSVSGSYLNVNNEDKVLLTVRDVTKEKKLQRQLEEDKQQAQLEAEQKSAFLANMSHEVRTPLNAIVGFAGLLATAPEIERNKYVEIIKGNTTMLLQLVNDILDISKIESGTLEFSYTDVDINQIMHELEDIFHLRLEEADSPVRISFVPSLPVGFIHTDKNRLSQVLSNFLSNAFKYTSKGSITLGYEVRANDMYFYVTDTGTGIPADKVPTVFERFTKLDSRKQGTGLGLAISQTIINKLGGEIGATSELGKGSTFWFTLPIQPIEFLPIQQKEGEGAVEESKQTDSSVRKTLLIAEDMDDNFLLCEAFLAKHYNLIRAVNGEEAVSLFLKHTPDAILMDIGMPVVDGYQATEAIRQMSSAIPIIAVTAFAFHEDKRKVMSRGFNGYLSKPLNKVDLFDMLAKIGV